MTHTLLIREIRAHAVPRTLPDGTPYIGINTGPVRQLAETFGITGRQVEIAALENNMVPERYARNLKSFSLRDQITLLRSGVTVIGLGGLGGTVTEILAREGVGRLTLIDGDRFEDSNLNRQLFSACDLLSVPKAEAAADRVARINPSLVVTSHSRFLTPENAGEMLAGSDVVVDCLDSLKTRFVAEKAAKAAGIPLVSAAIAGEAGHVTTVFPNDEGLRLIYGEPGDVGDKGAERALGCLSHAITILSALECSEVIKILLKKGHPLRNRMLLMDLADTTFEILQLI
ncbi:thiamine biosynthesis protein ThiF [Desulfonema ishimotonii]|uniref:Thiamine biosynthesis protein ThiF n=2 Tax=Desulfonema ishimotonii TaxID=45657 RepID=A0A401FRA5_9BACT|nr:thiamine biosynthesis protein ThiF [Desulfonema ishimotonii]